MNPRKLLTKTTAVTVMTATMALAAPHAADLHRTIVQDGPVQLRVSVDKVAAQVADPIQLRVELQAPRGTRVQLPKLTQTLGDFEVRNTDALRDIPAAQSAHERLWVLRATLETIKTGVLAIPSLDVQYASDAPSATFKTLRSEPVSIHIASVLEDRADPARFRDIKGTVNLVVAEPNSYGWVVWATAGAGAATAAALAVVLIARRNRAPSPAAWALDQINELEQLRPGDSATADAIYHELVEVVREFFELEFQLPATSLTTDEFLAQAANELGLGEAARQQLAVLVSLADESKFAGRFVEDRQIREAFANAQAIVHECERLRQVIERRAG